MKYSVTTSASWTFLQATVSSALGLHFNLNYELLKCERNVPFRKLYPSFRMNLTRRLGNYWTVCERPFTSEWPIWKWGASARNNLWSRDSSLKGFWKHFALYVRFSSNERMNLSIQKNELDFQEKNLNLDRDLNHGFPDL